MKFSHNIVHFKESHSNCENSCNSVFSSFDTFFKKVFSSLVYKYCDKYFYDVLENILLV